MTTLVCIYRLRAENWYMCTFFKFRDLVACAPGLLFIYKFNESSKLFGRESLFAINITQAVSSVVVVNGIRHCFFILMSLCICTALCIT